MRSEPANSMDWENEDDDTIWLEDGSCITDAATSENSVPDSEAGDLNKPNTDFVSATFHVNKISMDEYHEQGRQHTQKALRELKETQEFQRWDQTCSMCGACWYEGQYSQYCVECGASTMMKLCPICNGRCGQVWKRDVQMSHRFHEAHWNGKCRLSHGDQAALMLRNMEPTEDSILQAIADL